MTPVPPVPPVATYRLQLHAGFNFDDAAALVPYLERLGISHLYLSPIWAAAPGSMHGYDVTDHARVNEELGGIASFYGLCRTAREHDLGIILDIVPNHVGIAHHPWWRDVLRFGPESAYASYFDIAWEGQPQQQTGVLVDPVLGQPFGAALEAGELQLAYEDGELVVKYFDRTFPISPKTYSAVLGLPPLDVDAQSAREVLALLSALETAPQQEASLRLATLAALIKADAGVRSWLEERCARLNGHAGEPESFNELESLLGRQHYRLAYWRVSAEEINYRRFFDINELAGVRVEDPVVFEATHSLVREVVANGLVAGVRVDHIDGLYDPSEYLSRLRELTNEAPGAPAGLWVEKILARDEALPRFWPVDGTSGYDFLAVAGGLFVDQSAEQAFTAIYNDFTETNVDFAAESFGARRRISGRSFAGEVMVLAIELYRLAQQRRLARDNTLGSLRDAIAAMLATMPVYRTYLNAQEPMPGDTEMIQRAGGEALRRDPNVTPEAVSFLMQVLLLNAGEASTMEREQWVHFRRKFQQLSGPVMAKGVEDTMFFRYVRLLACNEVGDDPAHFGTDEGFAHEWFTARAQCWPRSLSATTTHDTKRSEDARMRLAALTANPRNWHREVRSWGRSNARHRHTGNGIPVPDRNTEYYFYQSLVASWEGRPTPAYIARMEAHMVKAAREAKVRTSWTRIDETYESSLGAFVRTTLNRRRSAAFIKRLDDFVRKLEPLAAASSLGLLTLKVLAPGIPDFFQGSERPLHSLTDPDNRRPVDYGRAESLAAAGRGTLPGLTDPGAKLWLTMSLLRLRKEHPDLFAEGSYQPLAASGPAAGSLFAFERRKSEERCIVIVMTRPGNLVDSDGAVRDGALDGTLIETGERGTWVDQLTGARFTSSGPLAAGDVLAAFPVAVLAHAGDRAGG